MRTAARLLARRAAGLRTGPRVARPATGVRAACRARCIFNWARVMVVGLSCLAGLPAAAAPERWSCTLGDLAIDFAFDRADLAPGITGEPPRRALAEARIGAARFRPEPFVMPDGTVGFHEDAGAIGQRMLVILPDGAARYSDSGRGLSRQGACQRDRE